MNTLTIHLQRHWNRATPHGAGLRRYFAAANGRTLALRGPAILAPLVAIAFIGHWVLALGGAAALGATLWLAGLLFLAFAIEAGSDRRALAFATPGILVMLCAALGPVAGIGWLIAGNWVAATASALLLVSHARGRA